MLIFDPREDDQPFFFHGMKQRMRDITKKQNKEMQFMFDHVFGTQSTNEDLFCHSISSIFGPLLDGYNCSGKFTYKITSRMWLLLTFHSDVIQFSSTVPLELVKLSPCWEVTICRASYF